LWRLAKIHVDFWLRRAGLYPIPSVWDLWW
jgi:hypothetical protein